MGYPTKIATCCYCGTKAALVLDRARHELSCASCGAPLHDMKRLPGAPREEPRRNIPAYMPHRAQARRKRVAESLPPGRSKRRKSLLRRFVEEAIDVLEDVFD